MKLNIEIITPVSGDDIEGNTICRTDIKDNLNFKNTEEFKFIISALIYGGLNKIIIDVKDLNEIDSIGIGSFITIKKKFPDKSLNIIITRSNDYILSLFRPIKIDQLIRLFPTIESGINYLTIKK